MEILHSLGGGEGIGAVIAAIVALLGLFPKLRQTQRTAAAAADAATSVAREMVPNSGTSIRDALVRMELQQNAISDSLNALRIEANITHGTINAKISSLESRIDGLSN